ncbi:hypothetical protein D3C81_1903380 [compost metagenome]
MFIRRNRDNNITIRVRGSDHIPVIAADLHIRPLRTRGAVPGIGQPSNSVVRLIEPDIANGQDLAYASFPFHIKADQYGGSLRTVYQGKIGFSNTFLGKTKLIFLNSFRLAALDKE